MFEWKDDNGKTYQIECDGVLTESGILLENGETLPSGKIVEKARELSRLWHAKDYRGFMEAYKLSIGKLNRDEDMLLAGTVINERGKTVRWAIVDAVDFLDDMNDDSNDDSMNQKIGHYDENDEAFTEMAGRIPGEAKIPGKPKKPGLIIAVGDREKNIAHFHVFRSEVDKEAWANGACIFFKENRYYDHGKNAETLTEDELNAVIAKLKQPHPTLGVSNWKYLVTLWNDNNYRYSIDPNLDMPDYDHETITRYQEGK